MPSAAYLKRQLDQMTALRLFAFESQFMKIDNNVPVPKQRRKAGSMPMVAGTAIAAYTIAYKNCYGVSPLLIRWEDGYFYLHGEQGVSLAVFRGKIKALKFRKG